MISTIDGIQLHNMLKYGLLNLQIHQEKINKNNVFPVADGDTGTNMCVTMQAGLKGVKELSETGAFLKIFCDGMLVGARGNSGTILSQFFKGFYDGIVGTTLIGPGELRRALIFGYKEAYDSMANPVEGTMLTVMKDGIENIRRQISRKTTIKGFIAMYVSEMRKSLSKTPELLPVLRKRGVVDSGAEGFIIIFEGMFKYLNNENIEKENLNVHLNNENISERYDLSTFNKNSKFEYGYCLEFVLQLMSDDKYKQNFNQDTYITSISKYGDSIAIVIDNDRVKLHIHTFKPAEIICLSQDYGEFIMFKLDNMQLQMNSINKKKQSINTIVIVDNNAVKDVYNSFGYDGIYAFNTNNLEEINIKHIINNIEAQNVIIVLYNEIIYNYIKSIIKDDDDVKIYLIKVNSFVEGLNAISMDIKDSDNLEYRIKQIESVIGTSYQFDIEYICDKYTVEDKDKKSIELKEYIKNNDYFEDKESGFVFVEKGINNIRLDIIKNYINSLLLNIELEYVEMELPKNKMIIGLV